MILTDKQLRQTIDRDEIAISPFEEDQMEPASYDLRVGKSGITTKVREKRDIEKAGFIEISSGDFALVLTEEIITLDLQHTARFGLRSKYARDGLVATVGTQVDPGFRGRLKVGLVNMSSRVIVLPYREHFLTIEFHRLDQPASRGYDGPYQDQLELISDDYTQISLQGNHAFSEAFENLRVLSKNVSDLTVSMNALTHNVDRVEQQIIGNRSNLAAWIVAVVASVIGGGSLVAAVMTWLRPVAGS